MAVMAAMAWWAVMTKARNPATSERPKTLALFPDNLRHCDIYFSLVHFFALPNISTSILLQLFTMGWFWADTAPSAPVAAVAPHPMPRGNAEPPVRTPACRIPHAL
jgi:hypothetical protein